MARNEDKVNECKNNFSLHKCSKIMLIGYACSELRLNSHLSSVTVVASKHSVRHSAIYEGKNIKSACHYQNFLSETFVFAKECDILQASVVHLDYYGNVNTLVLYKFWFILDSTSKKRVRPTKCKVA